MPENTKIILLADDDPEDQEILVDEIFKLAPAVQFKKVESGKQAVDFLTTCPDAQLPCMIILDYSMPIYNAAEILEQVSHHPRLQHIPKLVWSSSKQPEHVKACLDNGAHKYFVKPNKMSELKDIAKKMVDICYSTGK